MRVSSCLAAQRSPRASLSSRAACSAGLGGSSGRAARSMSTSSSSRARRPDGASVSSSPEPPPSQASRWARLKRHWPRSGVPAGCRGPPRRPRPARRGRGGWPPPVGRAPRRRPPLTTSRHRLRRGIARRPVKMPARRWHPRGGIEATPTTEVTGCDARPSVPRAAGQGDLLRLRGAGAVPPARARPSGVVRRLGRIANGNARRCSAEWNTEAPRCVELSDSNPEDDKEDDGAMCHVRG